MFIRLLPLASILFLSLAQDQVQDKSVFQSVILSSRNGSVDVHGEKYVRVFDPKAGKYAYKRLTIDNGKVQREAGFLDDKNPPAVLSSIPHDLKNNFSGFSKLNKFLKTIFGRYVLFK